MVSNLRKINSIDIISAINCNVEKLPLLSNSSDWVNTINYNDFSIHDIFSARIIFSCDDFSELKKIINVIPKSITKYIKLCKKYIVTLEDFQNDDEYVYELRFVLHPTSFRDATHCRKLFNQYFDDVSEAIENYLVSN